MYSDLLLFLKVQNLYFTTTIGNLYHTCCDEITIEVVDFNKTKTEFYTIAHRNQPKTVNALLFSKIQELFFVQSQEFYVLDVPVELINKALTDGDIQQKIYGTVSTFTDIMSYFGYCSDFETFFRKSKREKVRTLILMELTNQDYLKLRLSHFDKLNIVANDPVLGETILINCEEFVERFN
jgi:hypothetical protein